ncbi:MAG TPA: PKD domain-containing protein [Ktedonobacterales bacterium]|nr:PKD domain-containing protein [Ktedonobacterales bacterium]
MMRDADQAGARACVGWAARWLRTLALAGLLALGLAALAGGDLPGRLGAYATLRACGLGSSATMVANDAPALAYQQSAVTQGVPLGIFALDFQTRQAVTFYDDLSRVANAPDPNTVHWKWDFGDGSAPGYAYKSAHTYSAPGSYTVTVYIQDPVAGDWGDPFDHAVLHVVATTIANRPVAAARALTSPVIAMGSKITFDAGGSHAVIGSGLKYDWNFGDFTVGSGPRVTHEFDQQGHGMVTLTVTDARGARAIAQVPVVIVQSLQPATVTASPLSAPVGTTVSFDASGTQPPTGEPVAVAWDFGDGSPMVNTDTPTISHVYAEPGRYTVTVAVYGQQDTVGAVTTLSVTAVGAPARAAGAAGPPLPLIGGIVALVAAAFVGAGVWTTRRLALERERQAQSELARARRINGPRNPRAPTRPAPRSGHDGPASRGAGRRS